MPPGTPIGLGPSLGEVVDFFTEGMYMAGTNKEQLEIYGEFYNQMYQKIRDRDRPRQITRNAATMLKGAMFALGSRKVRNPEWQEQCASSLREILNEWNDSGKFESDYKEFFPKGLPAEGSDLMRELRLLYNYFSGIDHHNASGVLGSLTALLKNNSLKIEDCYQSDVFLARVQQFLQKTGELVELSKSKTP